MFWNHEELSFEQKIDYIYKDLRSKKRGAILKWIFRLIIFWLIIHFYITILPTLNKDKIVEEIWNEIIEIVIPIVEKTINSVDVKSIQKQQLDINKW